MSSFLQAASTGRPTSKDENVDTLAYQTASRRAVSTLRSCLKTNGSIGILGTHKLVNIQTQNTICKRFRCVLRREVTAITRKEILIPKSVFDRSQRSVLLRRHVRPVSATFFVLLCECISVSKARTPMFEKTFTRLILSQWATSS